MDIVYLGRVPVPLIVDLSYSESILSDVPAESSLDLDLNLNYSVAKPVRGDFGIGAVGAGFIMRDVQLKAYADAGFNVVGITSRTPETANEVAALWRIRESLWQL